MTASSRRGRELIDISPGTSITIDLSSSRPDVSGELHLSIEFCLRNATSWAPTSHVVAWEQFAISGSQQRLTHRHLPLDLVTDDQAELSVSFGGGDPFVTDLCASLWRAPTDNDGFGQSLLHGVHSLGGAQQRWEEWGLHQLEYELVNISRQQSDDECVISISRALHGTSHHAKHTTHISIASGVAVFDEHIQLPALWTDLPRVGIRFEVPPHFSQLSWFGLGPPSRTPIGVRARRWVVGDRPLMNSFIRTSSPRSTALTWDAAGCNSAHLRAREFALTQQHR